MEVSELGSNPPGIRKYAFMCKYPMRFCNTSFPQLANTDKTYVYRVTPLFNHYLPWKSIGADTWTSGILPAVQKTVQFRRMEVKETLSG